MYKSRFYKTLQEVKQAYRVDIYTLPTNLIYNVKFTSVGE